MLRWQRCTLADSLQVCAAHYHTSFFILLTRRSTVQLYLLFLVRVFGRDAETSGRQSHHHVPMRLGAAPTQ